MDILEKIEKTLSTDSSIWAGKKFWDELDLFLKRTIELEIKGWRKNSVPDEDIIKKLNKEYDISDWQAQWLLKTKFPEKI